MKMYKYHHFRLLPSPLKDTHSAISTGESLSAKIAIWREKRVRDHLKEMKTEQQGADQKYFENFARMHLLERITNLYWKRKKSVKILETKKCYMNRYKVRWACQNIWD